MAKETSAFSLIIFLFIILAAWWAVSSFKVHRATPTPAATRATSVDNAYNVTGPINIYHAASKDGSDVYSGSLTIPSCDEFLTAVSALGSQPARIRLSFTISRPSSACADQESTQLSVPFSVTFSSNKSSKTPVVDSVKVNNEAAAFSIVETAH